MSLSAWFAVFTPLAVALGLLAYHRAYSRNKRNSLAGLAGVLVAFLMPHLVLGFSVPFFRAPDGMLGYLGYGLMAAGLLLCGFPLFSFRFSQKIVGMKTDGLVTSGIYRFSRNPQYLFYGLVPIGYALAGGSFLGYLGAGLYWPVIHFTVLIEERHLEAVHGEAYLRYKKSTRRYL